MLRMLARIFVAGAVAGVLQLTAFSAIADDKTPPAKEASEKTQTQPTDEKPTQPTKATSPLANLLNSLFGGSETQTDDAIETDEEVLELEGDFVYDEAAEKKKVHPAGVGVYPTS